MEELQEDAGPQVLGRTQVEQLPSNVRYYGRFKGNRGTCESDGWPQQMKQKWGSEPSIKEHEDKIIKGLCYVQSMKSSKDASKFCDFFYFWLGEMFWNSSNKASFERIMQKIKEAVKVSQSYHGCNFEPPVNHGQYFTEWKRVYDLSVDCSRMQGGLYESTALFTEVYYNHLEEAVKAYNTVCTNDTREDEAPCKRIEAALGKNEHGKVLQLESETETVSKELAQSLHRRQYQGEKLSVGTTIYKNVCFGFSTTSTGDLTCSTTEEQRRGEAQGRDSGERHHERSHRDPVPAITQEGDPYLSGLPSRKVYDEYDTNAMVYMEHEGVPTIRSDLKNEVQKYRGVSECMDDIAGAWYYMKEMITQKKSFYTNRCEYFYYWLGDKVGRKLKKINEFQDVMHKIYEKLPKEKNARECRNLYDKISREHFLQMKKIYDHSRDYTTIKDKLQQNGYRCTKKFEQYLQDIFSTYDNVQKECNGKENDYCKTFEQKYGPQCDRKLAKLSCSAGMNATAAAVSSILGIVGLPLTTFFLYKYDLLPSWISNYFPNNRNKRRRAKATSMGRHHIDDNDTFTETSSTDMTTVASTTDDSIIYNSRPRPASTRRGMGENNNRHGRNIGYGRM